MEIYNYAVSESDGPADIFLGDMGVTCGFHKLGRQTDQKERVKCQSARDIPSCELVKIDTEGHEIPIILGLNFSATKAVVLEYHRAEDAQRIMSFMIAKRFRLADHKPSGKADGHGVMKFYKK